MLVPVRTQDSVASWVSSGKGMPLAARPLRLAPDDVPCRASVLSGLALSQVDKHAAAKPTGVKFAGLHKIDDLRCNDLGHRIVDAAAELQDVAEAVERHPHRLDVRGIHDVF
jgi:hypothetical protein